MIDTVKKQVVDLLGCTEDEILMGARIGIGTQEVIEAIIKRVPAPSGDPMRRYRPLII